jgi:hypothetical protein
VLERREKARPRRTVGLERGEEESAPMFEMAEATNPPIDLIQRSQVARLGHGEVLEVQSRDVHKTFDEQRVSAPVRLELSIQPDLKRATKPLDPVPHCREWFEGFCARKTAEVLEHHMYTANECVICLEAAPDLVLLPCYHQAVHANCWDPRKLATCPLCRGAVTCTIVGKVAVQQGNEGAEAQGMAAAAMQDA